MGVGGESSTMPWPFCTCPWSRMTHIFLGCSYSKESGPVDSGVTKEEQTFPVCNDRRCVLQGPQINALNRDRGLVLCSGTMGV